MRAFILAVLVVCTVNVASAPAAQAQGAAERYALCRDAAATGEERIADLCAAADDVLARMTVYDAVRHPQRHAQLQYALATALFAIGDAGDDAAARDSIVAARAAAAHWTRERTPTRWAAIQMQIAGALMGLGERGDEAAVAEVAPVAEAAAAAIRRSAQPELWASAQWTLANAYILQSRGVDREKLQLAAQALQAALEIYRRPVFAERRARAEARLAQVLRALNGDGLESDA